MEKDFGAAPLFGLLEKEANLLSNTSAQVSKSDHDFESRKEDGASVWSSVFEETKELIRLQENGSSSLPHSANFDGNKIWKGSSSKPKPKFSFFHSNREAPLPSIAMNKNEESTEVHQDLEGLERREHGTKEHSMAELLEGLQKDNKKQSGSELSTGGHRNIEHPIAELLESLLENHGPLRATTPKMKKETKLERSVHTSKRTRSSFAYRAVDKGDPYDPMDSTTSSDEEAAKFQLQVYDENQLKSTTPEINGHTIADRFQEALNAASVNDQGVLFLTSKQTSIGYYGRLQQVMQTEKERHIEFLNKSEAGIRRDEARFIDVKILSRYLDAKLTVCHCSLGEMIKGSKCGLNPQNFVDTDEKRTIIFSSRICNNVELGVGNLVRIHSPWKEVEVTSKDAGIILSTYFSQIPM